MPVTLSFYDNDKYGKADPQLPSSEAAAEAAKWCADRAHYRIAQQLMGLACALADLEATEWINRTAVVPMVGSTRNEEPRALDLGPKCEHGYWADGQACIHGCQSTRQPRTPEHAETLVMGAVNGSHAPMMCAVCGVLLLWQNSALTIDDYPVAEYGAGQWVHQGLPLEALDHEPQPVRTLKK